MSPTLLILASGMGSRYGGLKQPGPVGPSGETLQREFREGSGRRCEPRAHVNRTFQEVAK